MNREGIRRLAAEELGLPTSPYRFADTLDECRAAAMALGFPCLVKPVMSSSGKGSRCCAATRTSMRPGNMRRPVAARRSRAGHRRRLHRFRLRDHSVDGASCRRNQLLRAGRASPGRRATIRNPGSRSPWHRRRPEAKRIALAVTDALGGRGIFGVELFVKGEQVWFCEISPRPHDTGLVTLVSQDLSEFALHARAILGLPIPVIRQLGPAASAVVLVEESTQVSFGNLAAVLAEPIPRYACSASLASAVWRMGVALARDISIDAARRRRYAPRQR